VFGLHWFHGITMDTKVNDIGWFYVLLVLLLAFVIWSVVTLIKEWKR
jgi:hypothetical protein